jgi:hypothetical protein
MSGDAPILRSRNYLQSAKGAGDLMRQLLLALDDIRRAQAKTGQELVRIRSKLADLRQAIDSIANGTRLPPMSSQ